MIVGRLVVGLCVWLLCVCVWLLCVCVFGCCVFVCLVVCLCVWLFGCVIVGCLVVWLLADVIFFFFEHVFPGIMLWGIGRNYPMLELTSLM